MKKLFTLVIMITMLLVFTPTALAAGDPVVAGIKSILDVAMTWLLFIILAICAAEIVWYAFCKRAGSAQAVLRNQAVKNALICGSAGILTFTVSRLAIAFCGG
jgi:hypothetical protein